MEGQRGYVVAYPEAVTKLPKPSKGGALEEPLPFCGPFYLLPNVGRSPSDYPTTVVCPELTITRVPTTACLPGQIAVTFAPNPVLLKESFNSWWETFNHLSVTEVPEGYQIATEDVPLRFYTNEPTLYLDCQHGRHYGHFIADVLSQAWAYSWLKRAGMESLKLLVAGSAPGFLVDLLIPLGIERRDIVSVDQAFLFDNLIVPTKSYLVQGWTSPTAIETWDTVRRFYDRCVGPRRIFSSRRPDSNRPLRETAAVEALFASRGFEIVLPEDMSVAEQVNMFANAVLIAGLSGSNMFNLAFTNRIEHLFLISSSGLIHFSEQMFLADRNADIFVYIGERLSPDNHVPWTVNIEGLTAALDDWLVSCGNL